MLEAALTLGLIWATPLIPRELPYCHFDLRIDGDLGEWRPPLLHGWVVMPATPDRPTQRSLVHACWDQEVLRLAVRVADPDHRPAPAGLPLRDWHLHDLLQVYVDPGGDFGTRMNDDDVDVLLLPDGRSGTLRGDALLAQWAAARVPQREAAPFLLQSATRRHPDGWFAELQLPWLSLGVVPQAGHSLRMDVAVTDWHATADGGVRPAARTWSGDTDFGWPQRWQRLSLSGTPGRWETLLQRGPRSLALWLGVALLSAIGIGMLTMWLWHRRRLRAVLARLSPSAATGAPAVAAPISPASPAALPPTNADRAFAQRVLEYVRAHLDHDLSPPALAAQGHVSLRTLQRRLRSGLGVSPQELVLAARLEAAHVWLQQGECRVAEAAFRAGFADVSHFARRYRQAYGHPPSAQLRHSTT